MAKSKASFSNASIAEPVARKPHICVRQGLWRVSAMPRRFNGRTDKPWLYADSYQKAHSHARIMNIDQQRGFYG